MKQKGMHKLWQRNSSWQGKKLMGGGGSGTCNIQDESSLSTLHSHVTHNIRVLKRQIALLSLKETHVYKTNFLSMCQFSNDAHSGRSWKQKTLPTVTCLLQSVKRQYLFVFICFKMARNIQYLSGEIFLLIA